MTTIKPGEMPLAAFHNLLLTAIAPRPICFASTLSADGTPNLSPFSFFNIFGSNPVTLIFSPARRVRDNTIKHTLQNAIDSGEVVINVVNYAMVQQMSLASCEYPEGVNEFVKSGFTMQASQFVKPFRVEESPVQFECKVQQIIETGNEGGAGNLIVCHVVAMHIRDEFLSLDGKLDQHKLDLVGRLGSDWYVRASGNALFEVPKPAKNLGIGFDLLPASIRYSKTLTGNDLGKLANLEQIPDADHIEIYSRMNKEVQLVLKNELSTNDEKRLQLEQIAVQLLRQNQIEDAFKTLLALPESI